MKYRNLFFLLLVWEGFIWVGYNGQLLQSQIWVGGDEKHLYEEFYIGSYYYNTGTYMLVLAIVSVMAMEYCLKGEEVPILVRCRTRMDFLGRRWKTIIGVSGMYTLMHFSLGYFLSLYVFRAEFVLTRQTWLFYGVSAPLLFLFFLRTNVVYTLLRDVFNKKIFAMAGILGLYIFELFTGNNILTNIWLPSQDVGLGAIAYVDRLGGMEFAFAIIRQVGMTVIVAIISLKYFEHKDVMQVER